jgi:SecD/SecF fusion protein
MQNKGLIKFLTWTFGLACLFQLSFTVVTSVVESKAKTHAETYANSKTAQNEIQSLQQAGSKLTVEEIKDSIVKSEEAKYLNDKANKNVYLGYTYRECQSREINLGLDLKGGMNVMLEVSTSDVVRALANNPNDPLVNSAIDSALKAQKRSTNTDFVTLFEEEIVKLDKNVSLYQKFGSGDLRDKIQPNASNKEVVDAIRKETSEAYERTYQIISRRIDRFGVAQPTIQKLPASERILVELPGVKDQDRVRKLLRGTAQLEFWLTYESKDAKVFLDDINEFSDMGQTVDSTDSVEVTSVSNGVKLYDKLSVYASSGAVAGMARLADTSSINYILREAAKKNVYDSKREVKFMWGNKPDTADFIALYAIEVTTKDGSPLLDGGCITDASHDVGNQGNEVNMKMNSTGAREWKRITGENVGRCIAIVLDDQVYSAPNVNGEIAGGRSQITGRFTIEEAQDLANVLKSGKLPAPARIVSDTVVGPSLGQESIHNGLISFILAFIVVLIYMVVFYNRAGWVSVIALITNIFLLMGVLAALGAVLTLPGIAGIVLTMAMAVDGNVIIYERIKEELRAGSSVANAVQNGFKNAYSAIIDGQVTTFLLGLVLIMFGSGAVQGFAVTLCIGIATSLFTSIFITRLIIDSAVENNRRKMSFSFSFSENFLRNVHFDFLGKRKMFYAIAAIAIVVCVGSFALRGLSFGIDFTGGRTYVVRFDKPVDEEAVRASMAKQFPEAPEVKVYGSSNQLKITTKYRADEEGENVSADVLMKLYDGSKDFFRTPIDTNEFKPSSSDETIKRGVLQADQFGKGVAHDNLVHSIWALIGGLIVMFVYIGLRFRSWRFGIGSVTALAHDTILVIGIFSLLYGLLPFNLEVDQYFVSAVLTVIGYSINATVVIFDRVREYRKLYPKRDLITHMNDAINSTLARTVNTSGTTFVTLLMMFIFGGEVIRGFIFALLVGVVVGVFSSLCIACAVVYEISRKQQVKELEK